MANSDSDDFFLQKAIDLAEKNVHAGGGPFGAVIVKDGLVISEGTNLVTPTCDPTAHAEVVAIRRACQHLHHFELKGCVLYTSCEPCPMCLTAAYWSRVDRIVFAADRLQAAEGGFDDAWLYDEVPLALEHRRIPIIRLLENDAFRPFTAWLNKTDKVRY